MDPQVALFDLFKSFASKKNDEKATSKVDNFQYESKCLQALPDLRCIQYIPQDVLIQWGKLQLESSSSKPTNRSKRIQQLAISIFTNLSHLDSIGLLSEENDTLDSLIDELEPWLRNAIRKHALNLSQSVTNPTMPMITRQRFAKLPLSTTTNPPTRQPLTDITAAAQQHSLAALSNQQTASHNTKPKQNTNLHQSHNQRHSISNTSNDANFSISNLNSNTSNVNTTLARSPNNNTAIMTTTMPPELILGDNYITLSNFRQPTISTCLYTGLTISQLECLMILSIKHNYFNCDNNNTINDNKVTCISRMCTDPQFMGIFANFLTSTPTFMNKISNILQLMKLDLFFKHGHNLLGAAHEINSWFNKQYNTQFVFTTNQQPIYNLNDNLTTRHDKVKKYLSTNGVKCEPIEWFNLLSMSHNNTFTQHINLPCFVDNNNNICLYNDIGNNNLPCLLNEPTVVHIFKNLPSANNRVQLYRFLSLPANNITFNNNLSNVPFQQSSCEQLRQQPTNQQYYNHNSISNPWQPLPYTTNTIPAALLLTPSRPPSPLPFTSSDSNQIPTINTNSTLTMTTNQLKGQCGPPAPLVQTKRLVLRISLPSGVTVSAFTPHDDESRPTPTYVNVNTFGTVELIDQPFITTSTSIGTHNSNELSRQLLAQIVLPDKTGVQVYIFMNNTHNNMNNLSTQPTYDCKLGIHGEIHVQRPTHTIIKRSTQY